MNIIMPLAGLGKRLESYSVGIPKPLVVIKDKPIVQWAIESIQLEGNYIFCCKQEHIDRYNLNSILKKNVPDCKIIGINFQTRGTAETILQAKDLINNDEELLISDSDHYIKWDTIRFNQEIRKSNIDGCVMIYPDKQDSSHYSYVKLDKYGFVIDAAEKKQISMVAACGIHYYKKGKDFVKYATKMIENDIKCNNEFYVTPIYNEFIKDGKKITAFPIIKKWAMGNPIEIQEFLDTFNEKIKT